MYITPPFSIRDIHNVIYTRSITKFLPVFIYYHVDFFLPRGHNFSFLIKYRIKSAVISQDTFSVRFIISCFSMKYNSFCSIGVINSIREDNRFSKIYPPYPFVSKSLPGVFPISSLFCHSIFFIPPTPSS